MTNIPQNIFHITHLDIIFNINIQRQLARHLSPLIPLCRCSTPTGDSSGGGSLFLRRVVSLTQVRPRFENDPDVFVRGDLGGVRDGGGGGINQGDTGGAARTAAVAAAASPVGH